MKNCELLTKIKIQPLPLGLYFGGNLNLLLGGINTLYVRFLPSMPIMLENNVCLFMNFYLQVI